MIDYLTSKPCVAATAATALLAGLAACAPGSSTETGEPRGTGEHAGTLTGVIEYQGHEPGPLRVAAFSSFPPRRAPIAEIVIEDPVFPQTYRLDGVPPGRYFVLAVVDTDPGDGDRYRPRVDPGGTFGPYRSPASVTIDSARPANGVDIQLVAPAAGSPWDR